MRPFYGNGNVLGAFRFSENRPKVRAKSLGFTARGGDLFMRATFQSLFYPANSDVITDYLTFCF
ncbi:MAG: hypothetical protein DCC59_13135 [Chloroflexi bacterium]|nr:hypothetical protein [Chloroflexota bacterium]RIK50596.1 MAG: hypothetical protein DCC59_13135 [Chloroflexota bacterium]